jgi:hypothetical protein
MKIEKWYVIAWRIIWAIPVYFGFCISFLGFLCGWGLEKAMEWWDDVTP